MKIVHIIDSLEINGGSMMCFEMASAMRRDFKDCQIECLVVSKTGEYGRKKITAKKFAQFYGWEMPSIKYDEFYKKSCEYKDCIILHHRLECTRPLKFKIKPFLYLVINHTVQSLNRLKKFSNADLVVSVCKYLRERSPALNVPHKVILNGISQNNSLPSKQFDFITGRCHRLPSSKFSMNSLRFIDSLPIKNHKHFIAGPDSVGIGSYVKKSKCVQYLKKLDDQKEKQALIRSFDVYFYDTYGPEGTSVAILEGLAAGVPVMCKPFGGNKELVLKDVNGYYYNDFKEARTILLRLAENKKELKEMKEKVREDFEKRLSVERCIGEYRTLIEKWKGNINGSN